jgi:hypothetical protein
MFGMPCILLQQWWTKWEGEPGRKAASVAHLRGAFLTAASNHHFATLFVLPHESQSSTIRFFTYDPIIGDFERHRK